MSSQGPKSMRPAKPPNGGVGGNNNNNTHPQPAAQSSRSSSLSSHLAMVELKQRILTSLSKLSDRDTHHIALEELESTISTLQNDAVPMLLNCLFDASSSDPKPAVKKEALRLLATLSASHPETASTHLVKIIAHIAKRLRDPDSAVRDACRDTIGCLSGIYLCGTGAGAGGGENGAVSLFVKPLFEAMGENNKGVQIGAAMCLGRVVECAKNPPVSSFQKTCPRICKYLNSPNFFARSALLPVVATLSQVGAIAPQSLDTLLQSIHECLTSTDWATRKAAADTLSALALHSSDLVKENTGSTLAALEACRFDKIKPVRDSMTEALQLWKKVAGKGADGFLDDRKSLSSDARDGGTRQLSGKNNQVSAESGEKKVPEKFSSNGDASNSDSAAKTKNGGISDKTVGLLKKKVPALNDKELNPEFFQKLEKRVADDLLVEVVLPRNCINSSNSHDAEPKQNGGETENNVDKGHVGLNSKQQELDSLLRNRVVDEAVKEKDARERAFERDEKSSGFTKAEGQSEGSLMNSKGNWLAIQRQLLQLERQQTHLMNMLQDFMGGSHDSMITLENRVRGLERVVEDMVQELSMSSGRRGNNFMSGYEGSSTRSFSRYNGYLDYGSKFGRGGGDSRLPLDGIRGRGLSWRSDLPDSWEFQSYGASRSGQGGSRRDVDGRSPKSEPENDQGGGRRAWDKGPGPLRLGEGPSARSVWQASKDEATLEAIRVAGEDNGTVRPVRVAIPEMTAEAMGDENGERERDPVWTAWFNAMDALHAGDVDSAYAEVLGIGDEFVLVKLMDRSGPVLDQLSNEVAVDVLSSLTQLVMDENLFDLCLCWVQQLADTVMENGPDIFDIPMELKRELLFNFSQPASTIAPPEDWEGGAPEQLILQLASAWGINLHHGT